MSITINHDTNDLSATGSGSITIDGATPGGGATELITAETSFSGVTSITLSLNSAYDIHVIQFFDVTHNDAGPEDFQMRLGDSSGTIITSSTYEYQKPGASFATAREWIEVADNVEQSGVGSMPGCEVTIYSAADSSVRTFSKSWSHNIGPTYTEILLPIGGRPGTTEVNANVYFFFDAAPTFSGSYKVWGYKL